MGSLHDPLNDFPLRPEPPLDLAGPSMEAVSSVGSGSRDRASLPDRALGVAADVATSILVVLVALLAGFATRGRTPAFSGLGWAALFALYVSFFAIVVPLVLFGRTVGMALAGLIARDGETGRRLTPSEAVRRWAGTLATVAALGVPLFWTVRNARAPTLADRLSGRTLVRDA